jgi:hypothetical protein
MNRKSLGTPGVMWILAWISGLAALSGLVLPWYAGTIETASGPLRSVERGLRSPESWAVAISVTVAMMAGLIGWLRSRGRPGVGLTALAFLLAGAAFGAAFRYGSHNADPLIVRGRTVDAGLGAGLYISLLSTAIMALALAAGVVVALGEKKTKASSNPL